MKNWLALVCVLGSLCGGVFTLYSPLLVGSDGLTKMGASLTSIGVVVKTYHTNLNAARTQVWPSITTFQTYVNTTYKALNTTYGATQQNMVYMMDNLEWFTRQFYYAEQQVNSQIGYDVSQLNNQLQQTMDSMMQMFNSLISSYAYQDKGDNCTLLNATASGNLPTQLTKFGQCLQTEVDFVPSVVAPLRAILLVAQNDLKLLNKQLEICTAGSTNCVKEYFNDIYSELSYVNMELYLAQNYLSTYQQEFMMRNQFCGELIRANVDDTVMNLQMQFSQCLYPQQSMG